VDNRLRIRRL
jgi:AraC-like DNA-binding protein